jgi:hypothetical protein
LAEYEQVKANQQDQYRKSNGKWPHLSEYADQFVLQTAVERKQKTEYVLRKKKSDRSHQDSNLESPAP